MAASRTRSAVLPLALLVAASVLMLWAAPSAFSPASPSVFAAGAAAAAAQPQLGENALQMLPDAVGASSLSIAGMYEPIMFGMVLGLVPTTILGLFVAAWLQYKKGPTLGV
eukprot:CAMPEP_0117539860 /NCGR_PEP_ID=MMETSP0784-20121206/43202_1 /TAXON_ID=39447 /ORGANISM="" /LENGTH=110 /DNA_ID=CAMNT_0005336499 /DNA_START=24 /DNA_END=356 /DNA_ORIENTATION=+